MRIDRLCLLSYMLFITRNMMQTRTNIVSKPPYHEYYVFNTDNGTESQVTFDHLWACINRHRSTITRYWERYYES